jgi:Protein of unknown function (DUF2628)
LVVFTVYEPPHVARNRIDRAAELVFVKDGFSWLAAIVPPLWFLVKGLWLELALFIAAATLLTWGIETSGAAAELSGTVFLIVQIVIGFEAGLIQATALERRGWRLVGTVTGHNQDRAERRFFETWQPGESAPPPESGAGAPLENADASWTATMLRNAKDGLARGRRLIGAKA